jgi:hypothetical protein
MSQLHCHLVAHILPAIRPITHTLPVPSVVGFQVDCSSGHFPTYVHAPSTATSVHILPLPPSKPSKLLSARSLPLALLHLLVLPTLLFFDYGLSQLHHCYCCLAAHAFSLTSLLIGQAPLCIE